MKFLIGLNEISNISKFFNAFKYNKSCIFHKLTSKREMLLCLRFNYFKFGKSFEIISRSSPLSELYVIVNICIFSPLNSKPFKVSNLHLKKERRSKDNIFYFKNIYPISQI